jgi:hypothetical protein
MPACSLSCVWAAFCGRLFSEFRICTVHTHICACALHVHFCSLPLSTQLSTFAQDILIFLNPCNCSFSFEHVTSALCLCALTPTSLPVCTYTHVSACVHSHPRLCLCALTPRSLQALIKLCNCNLSPLPEHTQLFACQNAGLPVGISLDRQELIATLPQVSPSSRLQFATGNFFEPLPAEVHGANAILMKFIM